jgi:hypothetical protein
MLDLCEVKPSSKSECQYRASRTCVVCGARMCGKHSSDHTGILQCRDCAFPPKPMPEATELSQLKRENEMLRSTLHKINMAVDATTGINAVSQINEIGRIFRNGITAANQVKW